MCLLRLHGPATPGWLAEMTGLGTGAVTGVVDRLERAGYVTRARDPRDRRRVIVGPDLERFERDIARHAPTRPPTPLEFLRGYPAAQLRAIQRFAADLAAAPLWPSRDQRDGNGSSCRAHRALAGLIGAGDRAFLTLTQAARQREGGRRPR